jgi:hypothetical protein
MHVDRLNKLHRIWALSHSANPVKHDELSLGTFADDLCALFARYPLNPPSDSGPFPPSNEAWTLPPTLASALHKHFSASCHRFASPLDVALSATAFSSIYVEDTIFGATLDAFSTPWIGSSVAHPPFVPETIARAIRYSIDSCNHSDIAPQVAAFHVLLLPDKPKSPLQTWIHHPLVRATARILPHTFHPHRRCSSPPGEDLTNDSSLILLVVINFW